MPFSFEKLDLAGAVLITPRVFPDDRGFFMETYKASDFAAEGIPDTFVQENHSASTRRVLRGLHFQTGPDAQALPPCTTRRPAIGTSCTAFVSPGSNRTAVPAGISRRFP